MLRLKRSITALAVAGVLLLAALPVRAAETEAQAPAQREVAAVQEMQTLPGCWSPLSGRTEEKEFILSLTTAELYAVAADTGEIAPVLASALPRDVTAEYAGTGIYGVPAGAARGYAFCIDLNPDACWEDGAPITADDLVFSLQTLLENGEMAAEFANAEGYLAGQTRKSGEVVSLDEAGYFSAAEAREAGVTDFYLDLSNFWGLEAGWQPVSDRTRFRDHAMPAGMNEQYVTAAYLYRTYLEDGAEYDYCQAEFLGICQDSGEALTIEDVGILKTGDRQVTLILARPKAASALALELEQVYLLRQDCFGADYGTSADTYSSYGPYRVVCADADEIRLEPNPNWWGSEEASYRQVICRRAD